MHASVVAERGRGRKKKLALPKDIQRIDDIYEGDRCATFLLCGTHEGLTDSIILVVADHIRKTLTLISIPRDLFYRNSKINYLSLKFGIHRLLEDISGITGIRVKRYLSVDMFAFIKIVDILGGVDVTLERDLVDPTYKTMDAGRWSYLSFQRGTHHLNGTQALRVARSRNYTSDFDRARRQQQVIKALSDKLNTLSFLDINKAYRLLQTLLDYVQTNLSPIELITAFSRLRDYRVDIQNVLDKSNVLKSSYYYTWLREQHIYGGALPGDFRSEAKPRAQSGSSNAALAETESSDLGPYILLPRNDDWNLIRWYVRVKLLAIP
jgi:LCP family protein required for cell wall assembly